MGLQNFGLYWMLAEKGFGRQATVARLEELAAAETQALTGILESPEQVRMHSFGIQICQDDCVPMVTQGLYPPHT